MSDRRIAMAFFIPRAAVAPEDALAAVGAGDGSFGPITRVEPMVDVLEAHVCVQLYFSERQLMGLRTRRDLEGPPAPVSEDGAFDLALAFRDACARSQAEVGFVISHDYDATPEKIRGHYGMVLARDASSLAAEYFALLYLCDDVAPYLSQARRDHDRGRDVLPGGPGLTIFAGNGWSRWA